jgi:hypothetical protein
MTHSVSVQPMWSQPGSHYAGDVFDVDPSILQSIKTVCTEPGGFLVIFGKRIVSQVCNL